MSKLAGLSSKISSLSLTALCIVGMFLSHTNAELPPSAYEKMQHDAPDVVRIHVVRVATYPTPEGHLQVELTADVTEIVRTKSKIKRGDILEIQYIIENHPEGWAGPGRIPVLKEGTKTIAFLKKRSGATPEFEPAAGRMSFSEF